MASAAYLGLALPTVRAALERGEIPHRRISRCRYLIPREALDRWARGEDPKKKATPDAA